MASQRNRETNSNKMVFGPFYFGLLCGLVFGFIISALIAWVISTKDVTNIGNTKKETGISVLSAKSQPSPATPSFDFYNKDFSFDSTNTTSKSSNAPSANNQTSSRINEKNAEIEKIIDGSLGESDSVPSVLSKNIRKSDEAVNNDTNIKQNKTLKTKYYDKVSQIEELKASLALLGYQPTVIENDGKFQFQLGPYRSNAEAVNIQKDLGSIGKNFFIE